MSAVTADARRRGRLAGLAAITVTAILWGTTGTAATFATAGPLAIGAAALGIGGLLQAVIGAGSLRRHAGLLRAQLPTIIVGGLSVALYPLAFYTSMHLAGVAVGSVVSLASAPLASGVLERLIDRRRLSRWWAAAAALGVAGSVLLCASTMDAGTETVLSTLAGIGLGLVAGATYAVYSWAAHRLMRRDVPRGAAMGAVFGLGGLLLMPVLLITGAPLLASPASVSVALYMALVPMFLGYVLFGYGLTKVTATTATTVTLLEPAVATLLAVVIVGERLDPLGWIGMAILAAVLVILAMAPSADHRYAGMGRAPLDLPARRVLR
ncbi:EamA family transporter [Microbacterium alcoholitolerans]|uniref:EamA family transporter n=1 Tax=unclassified Microbacterium TaxID=2609290 RepID=UPI003D183310